MQILNGVLSSIKDVSKSSPRPPASVKLESGTVYQTAPRSKDPSPSVSEPSASQFLTYRECRARVARRGLGQRHRFTMVKVQMNGARPPDVRCGRPIPMARNDSIPTSPSPAICPLSSRQVLGIPGHLVSSEGLWVNRT